MESEKELLKILERIAIALEKISESLSAKSNYSMQDENGKESPYIPVNLSISINKEANVEIESLKERQKIIIDFLLSRNIEIKYIPPEDEADEILDNISIFMGNRFNLIKPFLEQLKAQMNLGGTIKMNLKNKSQEEISSICQLCTRLYEIAFLEEYTYLKSPRYLLFARPNRIPKVLNFFSGEWLERFIRSQAVSLIKQVNSNLHFSYISNIQIKLPNKDDFELDFLLEIENEIYWFEAKSGDYQRYIDKYSKVSKMLDLDIHHSFMVLTDISETGAEALKKLFNMNVVKVEKFSEEFLNCVLKYQISEEDAD